MTGARLTQVDTNNTEVFWRKDGSFFEIEHTTIPVVEDDIGVMV
jgi:hypothetical protein